MREMRTPPDACKEMRQMRHRMLGHVIEYDFRFTIAAMTPESSHSGAASLPADDGIAGHEPPREFAGRLGAAACSPTERLGRALEAYSRHRPTFSRTLCNYNARAFTRAILSPDAARYATAPTKWPHRRRDI